MLFRPSSLAHSLRPISRTAVRSVVSVVEPLISDPFEFKNARKMRDTNSRFPKPNFVSFDAFGTIYVPKAPIHEQYHEIASQYGFLDSAEKIKLNFGKVYDQMLTEYPNYGKQAGMANTDEWWHQLIVSLLDLKDSETAYKLSGDLIERFKTSNGYHLFSDVVPVFQTLKDNNIKIIISSNSDPRVFDILESFGLMKFIERDDIYISYDVMAEKPLKAFFDAVVDAEISKSVGSLLPKEDRIMYLSNCWHIGDGHAKDYIGAVKAGWNGIYLDRSVSSGYLSSSVPDPEDSTPSCMTGPNSKPVSSKPIQIIANNRVVLSELSQIKDLFGL